MDHPELTPAGLAAFMARTVYNKNTVLAKALGCRPVTVGQWLKGRAKISHSVALALAALAHGLPAYEGTVADYMKAGGYRFAVGLANDLGKKPEVVKKWQLGKGQPTDLCRLALAALAAKLPAMV